MKISKYARQNWILFALSGFFAWVAGMGFADSAGRNVWESAGLFFGVLGGLGLVASLTALIVRLWDAE